MDAASRSAALRRPAARIRWDRVGRVALLLVLLGVIALYVNPLRNYVSTWGEKNERQAEVTRLERENAALRQRQAQLRDPRALEREARGLGMVRPGERAYVVEGLPRSGSR
jgi:cell division protein FtsB